MGMLLRIDHILTSGISATIVPCIYCSSYRKILGSYGLGHSIVPCGSTCTACMWDKINIASLQQQCWSKFKLAMFHRATVITSLCLRLHLPPRSHSQSFAAQERAGKGRGT